MSAGLVLEMLDTIRNMLQDRIVFSLLGMAFVLALFLIEVKKQTRGRDRRSEERDNA